MKNKILLYLMRVKSFFNKKRKFPLVIRIDLNCPWTKDKWELRKQISYLDHNNKILREEIKQLKTIIEIRDMQISLGKKEDY